MNSTCRITSFLLLIIFFAAAFIPITHAIDFKSLIGPSAEVKLEELFSTWDIIENHEVGVEEKTKGDMKIVEQMYEYISGLDNVKNVVYESDYQFSFQLETGLWSEYHRFGDLPTQENVFDSADFDFEPEKGFETVGNKTIGVYSPYYGVDLSMTKNYLTAAQGMADNLSDGWTIESWYGDGSQTFCTGAGNVESFKNFGRYSVVLVDSHGSAIAGTGKSYIWVPIPGEYDVMDIAEGHLLYSGGDIGVSGTYIEKYCTLPNSFIYLGICEGMKQLGTSDAFLRAGAGFVSGYTESVSFDYDGKIMPTICQFLSTVHKDDTSRTYSAAEACTEAKKKHGASDPYTSLKATLIWRGNNDLVLWRPVPVTGVEIIGNEIDLYANGTHTFAFETTPIDANGYIMTWESSNPEIASVDSNGLVTAHSQGTADITIELKDTYGSDNVFSASAVVNVLGDMAVTGIDFENMAYDTFMGNTIEIPVMFSPRNATNRELTWSISDETIASIDENGVITPIKEGKARVTATSVDGGFIATTTLRVMDLNGALNVERNNLSFTTSPQNYGWKPFMFDGKVVAISGNAGIPNSTSVLTYTISATAGQKLTFDYKVSSEPTYDYFSFKVNGADTSIKNISGTTDWKTFTYTCSSTKSYTFTWQFYKNPSGNASIDGAMVDNIAITSIEPVDVVPTGEIIFSEYFESDPLQNGWIANGLERTWEHDSMSGHAYGGDGFMRSDSYVEGIGEVPHENTLYSPAITIPRIMQNMTLSLRAKASDYIWSAEKFTVLVGSSPDNLSEKLSSQTTADYLRYTVDLSDFEGNTLYIAFRHDDSLAQSSLCVDDVELYATIIPPVISKLTYYVNGEQYAQFEYEEGETITPIDGPSEVGYTFSGWQGLPEVMPAKNVDVTGTLTKNTYTITFSDFLDNTLLGTITVEYGAVITEFPQEPVHVGYDFVGWDYHGEPIERDMWIFAMYEPQTFTVTLIDGVDGSTIRTILVSYGKVLTEFPKPPTHEGFVFDEWDYDNSPIVEDIVITANYLSVGDVNGDGVINTGDAVLILKGITGESLTPQQESLADFNGDGKMNTGDAVGILSYLINKTRATKPEMLVS